MSKFRIERDVFPVSENNLSSEIHHLVGYTSQTAATKKGKRSLFFSTENGTDAIIIPKAAILQKIMYFAINGFNSADFDIGLCNGFDAKIENADGVLVSGGNSDIANEISGGCVDFDSNCMPSGERKFNINLRFRKNYVAFMSKALYEGALKIVIQYYLPQEYRES